MAIFRELPGGKVKKENHRLGGEGKHWKRCCDLMFKPEILPLDDADDVVEEIREQTPVVVSCGGDYETTNGNPDYLSIHVDVDGRYWDFAEFCEVSANPEKFQVNPALLNLVNRAIEVAQHSTY